MDKTKFALLAVVVVALGLSYWLSKDELVSKPAFGANEKITFPREIAAKKQAAARTRHRAHRGDAPLDTQRPLLDQPKAVDSLQRALAAPDGNGALFVEVNAIANSPLAQQLMACHNNQLLHEFSRMKEEVGIDPAQDIDRLGMSDKTLGVTGFFNDLKVKEQVGEPEPYGDNARIFNLANTQGGEGYAAFVGDGLLLLADKEEALKRAVDRAEGRLPASDPMPASEMLSEVYGAFDQEAIRKILNGIDTRYAERAAQLVENGMVQLNVDDKVTASFDFQTKDAQSARDLAKLFGGGIAALRQQALGDGDQELAWLLEQARVRPGEGSSFELDLAVPGDVILKMLRCDESAPPAGAQQAPASAR